MTRSAIVVESSEIPKYRRLAGLTHSFLTPFFPTADGADRDPGLIRGR